MGGRVGGFGFLAMGNGRACLGVDRNAPGEKESLRPMEQEKGGDKRSRILEKLWGEGIVGCGTQVQGLALSKCRNASSTGLEDRKDVGRCTCRLFSP